MFGYVKPMIPMLRVGEFDTYKGVYCGLCTNLGKSFGPLARFTLSYDFTFAAMLYSGVNDEPVGFAPKRCPYNPLKKTPHMNGGKSLDFCSDIAIIMLYFKICDDIHDSGFFKALFFKTLRLTIKPAVKKAASRLPDAYGIVENAMADQLYLEDAQRSLDEACDPTATSLARLFEMMSENPDTKKVLCRLGYMIGRYVYICDALDDLKKDIKNNSFNPLKSYDDLAFAHEALRFTIAQAAFAYQLLEINSFKEILDNIIYLGLSDCADKIINAS